VLRLAVSSLCGEYVAPGLIELFSKRAADLVVEMQEHRSDRFRQLLLTRAVDAAIGPAIGSTNGSAPGSNGSTPGSAPDELRVHEFLRFQLVAVVGAGHPVAHARISTSDLAEQTWLLGPSAVDPASGTARMIRHIGVPEEHQRIFQSHAAASSSARQGAGIALCPAHLLAEETADGRLTRVQAPGCMVDGTWATYVLRQDAPNTLAQEFVRFASTPRATQAMLSRSGADIGRFRPRVHVTLWS
jgi:LysR family transcriptional regulator, low CO2-responsive transcriptional regulator